MIPGLTSPLTTMTPRTQQLYAVCETPTRELEKVSDIFKLGGKGGPLNSTQIASQLISNVV